VWTRYRYLICISSLFAFRIAINVSITTAATFIEIIYIFCYNLYANFLVARIKTRLFLGLYLLSFNWIKKNDYTIIQYIHKSNCSFIKFDNYAFESRSRRCKNGSFYRDSNHIKYGKIEMNHEVDWVIFQPIHFALNKNNHLAALLSN